MEEINLKLNINPKWQEKLKYNINNIRNVVNKLSANYTPSELSSYLYIMPTKELVYFIRTLLDIIECTKTKNIVLNEIIACRLPTLALHSAKNNKATLHFIIENIVHKLKTFYPHLWNFKEKKSMMRKEEEEEEKKASTEQTTKEEKPPMDPVTNLTNLSSGPQLPQTPLTQSDETNEFYNQCLIFLFVINFMIMFSYFVYQCCHLMFK